MFGFDFSKFQVLLKEMPWLSAGFGFWGAAMITFLTKDLPNKIASKIKKCFLTSLEIPSNEAEFNALIIWMERRGITKKFRSLRIKNHQVSAGFGQHFFIHNWRPFWIARNRVEKQESTLEEIRILTYGNTQVPLRQILEEAKADLLKSDETKIYHWHWGGWSFLCSQTKRSWDSIFLPDHQKNLVKQHIDGFFSLKSWYRCHGIPYRTGICLHGVPGTGKSSLVKAICAEYNLNLYMVDLASISDSDLKELFVSVNANSLILIEDIDTVTASRKRSGKGSKKSSSNLTLGGLLNAIDGVTDSDGRILVVTTNKIETLDPALLRPGRVDVSLELGVMTPKMFEQAFHRFFPDFRLPSKLKWKERITPAEFQNVLLEKMNDPRGVLSLVSERQTKVSQKKIIICIDRIDEPVTSSRLN